MGNNSSSTSGWDVFGRSCFCKASKRQESYRLLIHGLDAAGKTTILYRLHQDRKNEVVTTIPTIGFNVESLFFNGIEFVAWDVGGRDKMRALWRHYYVDTDGLIFVVDSNDIDRMEQARDEFWRMANEDELKKARCPVLLLCNKQDLPNAWSPSKIEEFFGTKIASNAPQLLKAIGCVATDKNQRGSLEEGLAWMAEAIEETRSAVKEEGSEEEASTTLTSSETVSSGEEDIIDSVHDSEEPKLMYDPTYAGGNITLERFLPIQKGTSCPFAKAAKLWGGGGNRHNMDEPEDETYKAHAQALTEFCNRVRNNDEKLDGFCIELDDPRARSPNDPEGLGVCVKEMLTAISDLDPSGERVMRVNYIGSNGWRFRFANLDFFVTTFAPCYPKTSSRYAFETNRAFLLLQPEISFERQSGLGPDTPHTNFQQPETIRDKTRVAFWKAGQKYFIPSTTNYAAAEHIVKPLQDDGKIVVCWWEDGATKPRA